MRKIVLAGLTATLFLAACNNNENEDTKKAASKTETEMSKKDKAEEAKKKIEKQKEKKDKATTEKPTTEKATTEDATTEETTTEAPKLDINNVSNRNELESIIYGDYSEMDKITAYKNAVESGIIPQGNVMEGPAINAYESSLRVESGAEKSIYHTNPYPNITKYDHLYKKDATEETYEDPYETTDMYQARADLDKQYENGEITKEEYVQWVKEMDELIQNQGN